MKQTDLRFRPYVTQFFLEWEMLYRKSKDTFYTQ